MSGYKFLLAKGVNPQGLNLLGICYAAKQAALKLASNESLIPRQILIRFIFLLSIGEDVLILARADAHPWTYRTNQSDFVPDKLHFTMDIKDSAMIQNNTHLTIHAYLKADSNGYEMINMWDVGSVIPKKDADNGLKTENDAYFDRRKQKQVNNWSMANLQQIDEPAELSRVCLGDTFIAVLPPDHDPKARTTQEAVGEEKRVREALEKEGQQLLGEQ